MTLQHIELEQLTVSPLNVRKYGAKDCADLVTSIRALGLVQPLLVRPVAAGFEVIAGQRRLNACRIIAEEDTIDPIPCLVMQEGDDAKAIEASLAENLDRVPMDEVDQYKAFAQLVKQGRDVAEIAATFGITERMVAQRLALGRLYAPILTAYRKGDVQTADIRSLTMASVKQQKAWWALVQDKEAYVPTGPRLKDWLFGGARIPVANALFDVEASGLAVVADLFGEESYFTDSEAFWTAQNSAIAQEIARLEGDGWAEVILMDQGKWFAQWEHSSCDKEDGGKVFVTVSTQGEVTVHAGYITWAEARRKEAVTAVEGTPRPELTKPAQNYIDLHRHAALRADLLGQSALALRLIAAHMICGSALWQVQAEPQKAAKPEIAESLAGNAGAQAFDAEREVIAAMLDKEGAALLTNREDYHPRPDIREVLNRLQTLAEDEVLRVLTFLMAESVNPGDKMDIGNGRVI